MTDRQGGRSHFDQQGFLTSRLDRVGNATTFDYIDPDGSGSPQMQFTYDGATSQMTTHTTATGATTTLRYDAAGTLRSRVEPGSATQQFSAALADISAGQGTQSNRATRSTARLGHLTETLDRSAAHITNPGESRPAKGESSVTSRNAKKRRAQRIPALRPSFLCVSSTTFTFDAAGQLLQQEMEMGEMGGGWGGNGA